MAIIITRTNLNKSGKGKAVAFHTAVIHGVVVNGLALIPSTRPGLSHFVSYPKGASYKDAKGETRYPAVIHLEKAEDRDDLVRACIDGYQAKK